MMKLTDAEAPECRSCGGKVEKWTYKDGKPHILRLASCMKCGLVYDVGVLEGR